MRRLFAIALVLAGCTPALPPAAPDAARTLVVTPAVAAPERRLQATVNPYTRNDIATLILSLRVRDGETETPVASRSLTPAELDSPVTFSHLRSNRAYRVRAEAFGADGALISVDALSYVDLTLGQDDAPTIATIPVRLQDRPFDGQATSDPVAVTEGGLVPAGVETIGQPAP